MPEPRRYIYQCRSYHKVLCDEVPESCMKRLDGHVLPCGAAIENVYELATGR